MLWKAFDFSYVFVNINQFHSYVFSWIFLKQSWLEFYPSLFQIQIHIYNSITDLSRKIVEGWFIPMLLYPLRGFRTSDFSRWLQCNKTRICQIHYWQNPSWMVRVERSRSVTHCQMPHLWPARQNNVIHLGSYFINHSCMLFQNTGHGQTDWYWAATRIT